MQWITDLKKDSDNTAPVKNLMNTEVSLKIAFDRYFYIISGVRPPMSYPLR